MIQNVNLVVLWIIPCQLSNEWVRVTTFEKRGTFVEKRGKTLKKAKNRLKMKEKEKKKGNYCFTEMFKRGNQLKRGL